MRQVPNLAAHDALIIGQRLIDEFEARHEKQMIRDNFLEMLPDR
jgi:hypothetical protein